MPTIHDLLLDLVAVQSDTGTEMERAMAAKLLALVQADPYFARHPELCGAFEHGDVLQRPVVWALRRGRSRKTLILFGHYDAVELEPYGWLKPYALDPARLKAKMLEAEGQDPDLERDLRDPDWGFGRGMADMKAGLAINLHTLSTRDDAEANLLFLAVPDEENMSSGALQSIPLLEQLKERFGLDYSLLVLTEPQIHGRAKGREIQLIGGTMGKMLPVVLAKGVLTHSAEILKGLNPTYLLAEIVRRTELSTDLVSEDLGVFTQPPTVQIFRDLKTTYDVSVPEYAAACLNVLFLKSRPPMTLLADLEAICRDALREAVRRYHAAFDAMAARGFVAAEDRLPLNPEVLTLAQLERRLQEGTQDFAAFKMEAAARLKDEIRSGLTNLPGASVQYLKALVDRARILDPVVVIGISPPYYPAVHRESLGQAEACLEGLEDYMGSRYGVGVRRVPYLSGMTDMSYTSLADPAAERRFLDNLALPADLYDVPVERIAALDIPALMIGPAGKDVHKRGERVYLPDVTTHVPALIGRIIDRL